MASAMPAGVATALCNALEPGPDDSAPRTGRGIAMALPHDGVQTGVVVGVLFPELNEGVFHG